MHYRNGREAKNGDKVVGTCSGNPVSGILHSATAGSDTCNGRVTPLSGNDPYVNIKDLLHVDDLPIPAPAVLPGAVAMLLLLGTLLLGGTGCSLNPSKSHVIHVGTVGTKAGISQNPITGVYELSLQRVQADLVSVPIMFTTNRNGDVVVIIPSLVQSWEVNAHNAIFGNVSSTETMATGDNAVQTTLGGQHQPINAGVGTGSNIPSQVPAAPATPAFQAVPATPK